MAKPGRRRTARRSRRCLRRKVFITGRRSRIRKKGVGEIEQAFLDAVARQDDIDFGARVLYVQAQLGAAHWSCAFTRTETKKRVHLDGIFVVQFATSGKALSFREWWHSDEG